MRSASHDRLALLWPCVILAVSSIPGSRLPEPLLPGLDKVAHFVEYGIWGWFLLRSRFPLRRAFSAALAFAAFDEIHQAWIPGRFPSFLDFVADAAGLLAILLRRR